MLQAIRFWIRFLSFFVSSRHTLTCRVIQQMDEIDALRKKLGHKDACLQRSQQDHAGTQSFYQQVISNNLREIEVLKAENERLQNECDEWIAKFSNMLNPYYIRHLHPVRHSKAYRQCHAA